MIIAIGTLSVLCAGLLIAIAVLTYLYRGQSRAIRRQANYIRELLMVRNANIHRVAVENKYSLNLSEAKTANPEDVQIAKNVIARMNNDYKPMIAPYESRKSTF